jgi:hypothetical protein
MDSSLPTDRFACLPIPADTDPTASVPPKLRYRHVPIRSAPHPENVIRIERVRMVLPGIDSSSSSDKDAGFEASRDGHICSVSQVFAFTWKKPNDATQIAPSRDSNAVSSFRFRKPLSSGLQSYHPFLPDFWTIFHFRVSKMEQTGANSTRENLECLCAAALFYKVHGVNVTHIP